MIERKTWEDFRNAGLLWWVNRGLHIFGWAIVVVVNDDHTVVEEIYPARCSFRGFDSESETEGFHKLTESMASNIEELRREASG